MTPIALRSAPLAARLAWLGILTALVDLGSAYIKVPLAPRGVTAGDLIQLLGTFPLLALYAGIALDLHARHPAGARIASVLFIAGVANALGTGVHVAANSIHDMLDHTGIGDPSGLAYFWDEHLGHYMPDVSRAAFAVALTAWESKAPGAAWGGTNRAPLVLGAFAYGFIYFATGVEGQTVPCGTSLLACVRGLVARAAPIGSGGTGPRVLHDRRGHLDPSLPHVGRLAPRVSGILPDGAPVRYARTVRVSNAFLPAVGALLAALCVLSDASVASAAKSAKPPKSAKSAKPAAPAKRPGGLTFEPYQIKMTDGTTRDAELGRFYVPESRDRDTTHLIRLAFLRWKSTSPKPGAPIVYLAGGPGIPGSALARVPAYARLFEKLRSLGDVIVPDQRGTGLSEPSLACAPSPPEPTMFESETAMRQAILKQVQRCVAPFRADGIAIEAFDTHESASDVEDIRRALGAERLRLVASSYGCELALETIRLFGPRIQRAALAGVRSPDKALKLPGVLDLQLRRISGLVAKDSSYASNPTVEVLTRALIGELDKRPISLSTAPASGGAQEPMKVAGAGLAAVLQGDLTDPRTVIAVPAMLNAMAAGDFRFFLSRLQSPLQHDGDGHVDHVGERELRLRSQSGADHPGGTRSGRLAVRERPQSLYGSRPLRGDRGSRSRLPIPGTHLQPRPDPLSERFPRRDHAVLRSGRGVVGISERRALVVDNGFHDTLPEEDVQQLVVDYLGGADVKGRRVTAPPPKFLSLDEARKLFEAQTQRPR